MENYINIQFEDPGFLPEFEEMLKTGDNQILIESVKKISAGTLPVQVLEEIILEAKHDGYQVDTKLAEVFFVLSELSGISKEYRDLALDTSILLSEDEESRVNRDFDPYTRFQEIKLTTG